MSKWKQPGLLGQHRFTKQTKTTMTDDNKAPTTGNPALLTGVADTDGSAEADASAADTTITTCSSKHAPEPGDATLPFNWTKKQEYMAWFL